MPGTVMLRFTSKKYRLNTQHRCRVKICYVIIDKDDVISRGASLLQQMFKDCPVWFPNSDIATDQKAMDELNQPKSFS